MTTTTASARRRLADLDRTALIAWCAAAGEPPFRADQIRRWVFGKRVCQFEEMHDLPAGLRRTLSEQFVLLESKIVRHEISADRTEKLLVELVDGEPVECVLMREPERRTVCISTQVGCGMGCVFCASGLRGVKRNLAAGEILEQVLWIDRLLGAEERITNVVVMGMGEPLANLPQLLPALDTLHEKGGLGLGARRITVSTVGLPEAMRKLADHGKPYNLAVSLHAPNDELRTRIVPVNARIGIAAILAAAEEFFQKTGRRVSFEYVLLRGLNDRVEHARELAAVLRGRQAHVNLIPMNPVAPLHLEAPGQVDVERFVETLKHASINVTVRKRKGVDINAACGQLRLHELQSAAS